MGFGNARPVVDHMHLAAAQAHLGILAVLLGIVDEIGQHPVSAPGATSTAVVADLPQSKGMGGS